MYYENEYKEHNLVLLYKALLSAGIFQDENDKELAFLLLSQDFNEAVKVLKSNG